VFHFNKKHLEDATVPMWVIKAHGVTFYVNHVSADIAWTTKETPDNAHTKGAIKFKKCKLTIDDNNDATVSALKLTDVFLKHPRIVHARAISRAGSDFHEAIKANEYQHSEIKYIKGACSSTFMMCDLLDKDEVLMAVLKYGTDFRIMVPNEPYYKQYDQSDRIIPADYSQPETPYEFS
jgi:hypothetical protein